MMLKSLLLIYFYFLVSAGALYAQFQIGAKAGAGVSQIYVLPAIEQEFATGQVAGFFISYSPEPKNKGNIGLSGGLQFEINYEKKGWKETANSFSNQVEYVQFVPLTHIVIGRKKLRTAIQLGPQAGFLMNAYQQDGSKKGLITETPSFADSTLNYEFGLAGGISFMYNTKAGSFGLSLRYEHALSNVVHVYERKPNDIIHLGTQNDFTFWMQNQFLNVSLLYSFSFGSQKQKNTDEQPIHTEDN